MIFRSDSKFVLWKRLKDNFLTNVLRINFEGLFLENNLTTTTVY